MKPQSIIILLLLLAASLVSCSPGHLGSNEIAFVRDGHLWTIDPDGANAFAVVKQETPVVSYSWSPNHQLLTFRALDATFGYFTSAGDVKADEEQQLASRLADKMASANATLSH